MCTQPEHYSVAKQQFLAHFTRVKNSWLVQDVKFHETCPIPATYICTTCIYIYTYKNVVNQSFQKVSCMNFIAVCGIECNLMFQPSLNTCKSGW